MPEGAGGKAGTARVLRYQAAVTFRPERFTAVPVSENARVRVLLVCLEPGQFIPVHRPGVDLTLVVLEGEGRLLAGERESEVGPGLVAFVPAGEARGLLATCRLVALTVVTPPPTEADHAGVVAGLRMGMWHGGASPQGTPPSR
jgi:quercetin dioxygenase-like cupin family protein